MTAEATSRDDEPARGQPWAWATWFLATLLFFYGFVQRVAPSVMIDDLMRDFAASGAILGNLSAFYFYAYASMQVPVGILLDYWGPKRLLTAAAAVSAAGTVLFAFSTNLPSAYLGRLLIGAGASVCFLGSLKIAMAWLPTRRTGMLAGLTQFIGMVGGVVGQAPLAALFAVISWRTGLAASAVLAVMIGAGIWVIGRDPTMDSRRRSAPGHESSGLFDGLRLVLRRPQTWLLTFYLSTHAGPMLSFAGLWGVAYLMVRYGYDRPAAAVVTSLVIIGWATGGILGGWVSDRIGRRKPPLILAPAVSLCVWLAVLFVPGLPAEAAIVLFALNGLAAGMMIVGFAIANEITPRTAGGSITGILNTGTMATGAAMQVLVGWILDLNWKGVEIDGARLYDVDAFHAAFLLYVAAPIVGLALIGFVRESYARRVDG
jgi:MFS family permease